MWSRNYFHLIAHPSGLYCPPPALFEMRVQSKKFPSTFSRDFERINSIVLMWFACSSQKRIGTDNPRGILGRIQVWLAPGVCWGVSSHQIIAAAQFHNPSRCTAKHRKGKCRQFT